MLLAALAECASAFADAGAQLRASVLEDRNGAEEKARENGNGDGEEQARAVATNFMNPRKPVRGHSHERSQGAPGKPQTAQAAEQTDSESLEPQFPRSASPTGPTSCAKRHSLPAACSSNPPKPCHLTA